MRAKSLAFLLSLFSALLGSEFPVANGSKQVSEKDIAKPSGVSDGNNSERDDAGSTKGKKSGNSAKNNKQRELSSPDFTETVKRVVDSVISIVAQQTQNESPEEGFAKRFQGTPFEDFFKNFAEGAKKRKILVGGSGFFIKVDEKYAYVVTNCHIVENSTKARILLHDKTEIKAEVHGVDPHSDLAVLRIKMSEISSEKRKSIKAMEWGDSDATAVGQWVLAIGNPFGLGNTVTVGIISAKSRDLHLGERVLNDDFIQHSAQINVGNSGGCLINADGGVVGINTVIITPSGGNVGIGFAIPSRNAESVINQLIKKKKIQRGALGVKVQDFTKEMAEGLNVKQSGGAVVAYVEPGGPASKAGVELGDVILRFDDVEITGISKLSRTVGAAVVDSKHKITILRKGKQLVLDVKLGDFERVNGKPNDEKADVDHTGEKSVKILGLTLVKNTASEEGGDKDAKGVLVVKVEPDSPADDIGLTKGDVIDEVNQTPVNAPKDFKTVIESARKRGHKSVFIRLKRSGILRFSAIKIDEDEKDSSAKKKKDKKKGKSGSKKKKEKKSGSSDKTSKRTEEKKAAAENTKNSDTVDGDGRVTIDGTKWDGLVGSDGVKAATKSEDIIGTSDDESQDEQESEAGLWGSVKRGILDFCDDVKGMFSKGRKHGLGRSGR